MSNHSILYKKTKTGAIQEWFVSVEDNIITVTQGQVGGAKQDYQTVIKEGKNIGKANETTPSEQAEAEALSKWQKQVKSGYTEDPSGAVTVELPMKVKTFQGQEKNIVYPCSGLPKMDGVNGTYRRDSEGNLSLWSRGGEEYPPLKHIETEIHEKMDHFKTDILAGEVYCHGMHLQDITAGVKKYNKNFTPNLQFFIFDLPSYGKTIWELRGGLLTSTAAKFFQESNWVFASPEVTLNNEQEAWEYHKFCVDNGFEGIVVNNYCGLYEYNIRSSNSFKLKLQLDAEYKCVDYKVDKNGQPVLKCITSDGENFWVKPEGDSERRAGILENITDWVDSYIKIRYEKLSKKGVPQKPVAECIRKCDENGEVLE